MKRTVRLLAWFAIAAQVAFVASWVAAGALTSGYSGSRSGVSALAADGMPYAWLAMAGMVVLGLGVAALVPGVRAVLPRRRAATVAAVLFAIAGAGVVVAAFARLDCDFARHACATSFDAGRLSWQTSAHVWAGFVTSLALIGTPLALARSLWPSPVALLAGGAGVISLALMALGLILFQAGGSPEGIVDRVQFAALHTWVVLVAAGILHETRGEPRLSTPTPLSPRHFLGSAWAGEGQVQPWPYRFWRRLGP
ncbi:MAG: hypothetical protein QOF37_2779, partial [Thermoleophilaceae bacterium]|nr:hypothetical protein [Thermoleophilaceae bacterium]